MSDLMKTIRTLGWLNFIGSVICLIDFIFTNDYSILFGVLWGALGALFFFNVKEVQRESIK